MFVDGIYFRVAGVSFDNDDGSSRQRYISKLQPFDALGMESFEYEGSLAFHILDSDDHCIGNLPKEHIDFVLDHHRQGHDIKLYVNEIFGRDEYGKRIDGYNLGVEVALDIYDDRPDEQTVSEPFSSEPSATPVSKQKQKTGCVMIGFGVFFALGFFVALNPVVLVVSVLLLFFGFRRHKNYKKGKSD